MHASSYENMIACCQRHLLGSFVEEREKITVVDIGAAAVNGSYREVFDHPKFQYIGVDLEAGPGVDIVLTDPYDVPLPDGHADVVISGQAIEHAEFFWLTFTEMMRLTKPDGLAFLIAPSGGPIHRYPVDCYRFYPDSYHALAKYAGCNVIDLWHDDRGPWNDLVGVFRHRTPETQPKPDALTSRSKTGKKTRPCDWHPAPYTVIPTEDFVAPPDAERMGGNVPYLEVLQQLHRGVSPSLYLEIGVRHGDSLALARCRAVGIDPAPTVVEPLANDAHICKCTSDAFFADNPAAILKSAVDLAFIDGMHLFEFALRDFMHVERFSHPAAMAVFDDIFPNHPLQAQRRRQSRVWTGDVWKIVPCLRKYRPDLHLTLVNTHPTGLLLVTGLNPGDRVLRANYNQIIRDYGRHADIAVPPDTLARAGALEPRDPRVRFVVAGLRQQPLR